MSNTTSMSGSGVSNTTSSNTSAASSKLGGTQKKSCVDNGAAKLFEKATELRSSLDVPSFRVPIVRDTESHDSISLPSSPMSSRKIGLSYLTPPTSRKMGSCRSPTQSTLTKDCQETLKEPATAPVTITCHLAWPKGDDKGSPSVTNISRSSSPGPFTSVLKSGSLGEETVTKVLHETKIITHQILMLKEILKFFFIFHNAF